MPLQSASCQPPNTHHVTLQYLSSHTCFITRVIDSWDGSSFETRFWHLKVVLHWVSNTHCLQTWKLAVKKLQIPSLQRTAAVFSLKLCQFVIECISTMTGFHGGENVLKCQSKLPASDVTSHPVHPCSVVLTKYGQNLITLRVWQKKK